MQALQLYLVGSGDKPKAAPHLGQAGGIDLKALMLSAKLLSETGSKTPFPAFASKLIQRLENPTNNNISGLI